MKLRTLEPKVRTVAPRLGVAAGDEAARDRQRYRTQPWRRWYDLARWKRLREEVLVRDLYTCRRSGVLLVGKRGAPDSPAINHIVPHRGDPRLFWDPANLEAVSKAVHDSEIQAEERRGER